MENEKFGLYGYYVEFSSFFLWFLKLRRFCLLAIPISVSLALLLFPRRRKIVWCFSFFSSLSTFKLRSVIFQHLTGSCFSFILSHSFSLPLVENWKNGQFGNGCCYFPPFIYLVIFENFFVAAITYNRHTKIEELWTNKCSFRLASF